MAGGFDFSSFGTGFSTGLLNGAANRINNQNEMQQQELERGDEQNARTFQEAASEYDGAKAKQTANRQQVESLASSLAASGNNGQGYGVTNAARITAQDAINQGLASKPEWRDFIQQAYEKTYADEQANPKKYNIQTPTPTIYDTDTNPAQTASLRRMGNNTDLQTLEAIRHGDIGPNDLAGLPGAKFGSSTDYLTQKSADKSFANKDATNQAQMDSTGRALQQSNSDIMQQRQQATQASGAALHLQTGEALADHNRNAKAQASLMANGYDANGVPVDQSGQQPPTGAANGSAQVSQPPHMQSAPQTPVTAAPVSAAGAAAPQAGTAQSAMQSGQTPPAPPQSASPAAANPPGTPPPPPGISVSGNAPPEQGIGMGQQQPQTPQSPTSQGAQNNQAAPVAKALTPYTQNMKVGHPDVPNIPSRNWAALDQYSPQERQAALAMSEGVTPLIKPNSGKDPAESTRLFQAATEFDPSVSGQRYKARDGVMNGKDSVAIGAINTAMNHVAMLRQASLALNNGNVPLMNSIINKWNDANGAAAPMSYDGTVHYVAQELRKIYSNQTGGTVQELNDIADDMDKNKSPVQAAAMFSNIGNLLDGKVNSIDATMQRNMGLAYKPQDWMSPEARSSYQTLKAYNGQGQPINRNGQVIPQAAIDLLKQHPGSASIFESTFGRPASAYLGK